MDERQEKSRARFWDKVAKQVDDRGCWEWCGSKTNDGYGASSVILEDGKSHWMRAHRMSYRLVNGASPAKELHHICHNKLCVRPDHLQPLTRQEHMRLTPGTYGHRWAHRTHCEAGHPLVGDNLLPFATKRGYRACRECSITKTRVWQNANREKAREASRRWKANNLERTRQADRDRYYRAKSTGGL